MVLFIDYVLFVCGFSLFMELVMYSLCELGVLLSCIYVEKFLFLVENLFEVLVVVAPVVGDG